MPSPVLLAVSQLLAEPNPDDALVTELGESTSMVKVHASFLTRSCRLSSAADEYTNRRAEFEKHGEPRILCLARSSTPVLRPSSLHPPTAKEHTQKVRPSLPPLISPLLLLVVRLTSFPTARKKVEQQTHIHTQQAICPLKRQEITRARSSIINHRRRHQHHPSRMRSALLLLLLLV